MEISWQQDYKRLNFLPEEDYEYLIENDPSFRRIVMAGCPTCDNNGHYQWHHQGQACDCIDQLALYKHYTNANIGLNYQRLGWSDYLQDDDPLEIINLYLTKHSEMIRSGIGLFIHGTSGLGKTMLASLAAKELVRLGYSVYFATFAEMIDKFTRGWTDTSDRSHFERKVVNSDIFILDDIGKEFRQRNGLNSATFDSVLRKRANGSRPTIITTNLTKKELQVGYGASIFSLLSEKAIDLEMVGHDYRPTIQERILEEIKEGERRPIC